MTTKNRLIINHSERPYYDLAVIGGGLSATATIIKMLSASRTQLNQDINKMKQIIVFDKEDSFGGGNTYSSAMADATFLQNPVDMMPDGFAEWIISKGIEWLAAWCFHTSSTTRQWWQEHKDAITRRQLASLFVPRGLFGLYQTESYRSALSAAKESVVVQHVAKQVTGLIRTENDDFILKTASDIQIRARIVLLAMGMIPSKPFPEAVSYLDKLPEKFVVNLASKAKAHGGNIILLGANAAAMDVIHLFSTYESALTGINEIIVVSKTGIMPISTSPITGLEPSSSLIAHPTSPRNAAELVSIVLNDAACWHEAKLAPYGLTLKGISNAIIASLNSLPAKERTRILEFHGRELSLISRRCVPAYYSDFKKLKSSGRLKILAAEVNSVCKITSGISVNFSGELPDLKATAVIDCSGAGRLNETNDPLLAQLLRAEGGKLAQANAAGSGFVVNDRFEASPNLFIMGDLLTGYEGRHGMIWHLQNAPRIKHYSSILGEVIAERL